MSLQTHLESLSQKHAQLESQINDAYMHHQDEVVARLKKKKLSLKDEMTELLKRKRNRKQAA